MDRSDQSGLPAILADTESLQRQLEQRYGQILSKRSGQADQADKRHETAMVIKGK